MNRTHMQDQIRRILREAKPHPLNWLDLRVAVLVLIALEVIGLVLR